MECLSNWEFFLILACLLICYGMGFIRGRQ